MVKVQSRPRRLVALAALALLTSMLVAIPTAASADGPAVFINEIHYDNAGTDAGEAIEVAGPAGTDLTGWTIALYNGNGGGAYNTTVLSGSIPDLGSGYGTVVVTYPSNGIQNGSPDGLALIDDTAAVIEFLSYEGVIVAADGPAVGMTSTDIGVEEPGTTLLGDSLQLTGTGLAGGDFTWAAAQIATFGAVNTGQVFAAPPDDPPEVSSTDPIDGAIAVSVASDITITFNEAVTVAGSWYDIACSTSVAVVAVVNGGPTAYTLNPVTDLAYDETCTVTVFAAQVTDQDGTPDVMVADFSFGFTVMGVPSDVVINEIDYDQPSTDTAEFVELYNASTSSVNLSTWTLELVNGTGGGATVYNTIALPDVELVPGGFYVVCANAATTPNCDLDASPNTNFVQNGAPDAVGLRDSGTLMDAVSYEGDTGAPYTEGSGAGLLDDPDAGILGISRLVDGGDTNQNNVDLGTRCSTPGAANSSDSDNCAPTACYETPVLISVIQGSGTASPCEGVTVTVEGVVVADEETYASLAGFFVQEEDDQVDGDPSTSEGIFVFNANNDTVNIGDVVQVEGEVQERFYNTQLSNYAVVTDLDPPDPLNPPTATPVDVTFPLTSIGDLEAYEGMAVTFPQTLAISEYFNYDRFGEVVVGLPTEGFTRQMNPTALYEPGSPEGIALAADNTLSRITIDDGSSKQNPDNNVHPIFRDAFSLENRFRGGDAIGDLTGAVHYNYDVYKLYPNAYSSYVPNDRPGTTAPSVGGRLQVATLNALNYFVTIDDGSNNCGPNLSENCRGADSIAEFERQRAKLLEALVGLDADVVGLVELENTYGVEPLADIVAGLNAMLGARTYDYVDAGVTGPDVIKVGVIYKPAAVTQIGQTAVLDTPEFLDPNNTGSDRNRAALGVSFLEKGTGEKFSVAVNHFKSKGSSCGSGDDSEFAGSCDVTRTLAAGELLEWIGTNPTNAKDADWLITGDLNSYDMEAPIDVLRAGDYTDLVDAYEGESAYSYVYNGEWGYLDYAMSSASLTGQVTRAAVWHINADEPDIFDYDMSYKSSAQADMFAEDPYRSSDHDAVIVGLALNEKPGKGNHGDKPGKGNSAL